MPANTLGKYHPAWNDIGTEVWKLIDSFTAPDAAALIAGIDPAALSYSKYDHQLTSVNFTDDIRPSRANTIFQALIETVMSGELKASMPEKETAMDYEVPF